MDIIKGMKSQIKFLTTKLYLSFLFIFEFWPNLELDKNKLNIFSVQNSQNCQIFALLTMAAKISCGSFAVVELAF